MKRERQEQEQKLTTADLAVAGERPARQMREEEPAVSDASGASPSRFEETFEERTEAPSEERHPAPLFSQDVATDFREQWDSIQIGFVDDPRNAVRRADELVAQVMKRLAETFARERDTLEKQLNQGESASTENLRVTLTSYRSFFKRLLSL